MGKVIKSKINLGQPFMVPHLVNIYQMISLREI